MEVLGLLPNEPEAVASGDFRVLGLGFRASSLTLGDLGGTWEVWRFSRLS